MSRIIRYKMVLFGDSRVGKTSLVERFIHDKFEESYISTLGYNVYEKQIPYKDSIVSLMIWDIGGQEKFRDLRKRYAEGAHIAFIVFDVTNKESFLNVTTWRKDLEEFAKKAPFILIGNKMDLDTNRQVSKEDGERTATELGALDFFETSAKTGAGVENAFTMLATKTFDAQYKIIS
jgi:Ras-related protein Rab-6A